MTDPRPAAADRARPSSPLVRLATPADALAIATIQVEGWRSTYRGLVPDAILDGRSIDDRAGRWSRTLTERQPDHPQRTWVVAVDGDVRGFAATCPARDESAPPPDGAGEVAALYVDPARTGRGLGGALFERAVDDLTARGFDPIVVWVFEANARARRFYEAAGFRTDGTRFDIDFDGTMVPEIRYRRSATPDRP